MKCNLYFNIFAGPSLPYKLYNSAMATSPDGGGVILFGGKNYDKGSTPASLDVLVDICKTNTQAFNKNKSCLNTSRKMRSGVEDG